MTTERSELASLARCWLPEDFLAEGIDAVQTPALVINRATVDANIATMRTMLGDQWRPHVKTAKLEWTMRRMVEAGVRQCKCVTPLELESALRAGFADILVAFAHRGPGAHRIAQLAESSDRRVSVLVEDSSCLEQWRDTPVSVFIDVDPGTGRSGIPCREGERVVVLARDAVSAGVDLRGLHFYDGAPIGATAKQRGDWSRRGLDALCVLWQELARAGHALDEIVTSGSRTWPQALTHGRLSSLPVVHTLSPGTVVYSDARTAVAAPGGERFRPAAVVVTRVISVGRMRLTVDAGHKAIAFMRAPPGIVLGHPELEMQRPSEEHGPIAAQRPSQISYGDLLAVVPSNVGPTVNLHDHAVIVDQRAVVGVERVTARGHDIPL